MAGREPGVDAVRSGRTSGAAALVAVALSACSPVDEPPDADWEDWQEIDGPLAPELGAPAPGLTPTAASAPRGRRLRIVSYNVAFGEDVDAIAEVLRRDPDLGSADVYLLQEIESYPDEGGCRAARLADRLGLEYAYAPSREKQEGTHGLAILSAHPISDFAVMRLPRADVPRTGAPRIATEIDITVDDVLVRVVNVHLDTTLNVVERVLQLRPAAIDQPDPVILAGDFNTNDFVWAGDVLPLLPLASALDTRQAGQLDDFMSRLGFAAPTAGWGATERYLGHESRLDSIYVRGLVAIDGGIERDVDLSDHWPLWLDVELP